MLKTFTCIVCPNGCDIAATVENGTLSVTGNLCAKGEAYVKQELTEPKRTITSSILVEDGQLPLASVRLTTSIPKERIFDVMSEIKKIRVKAPVTMGEVIIKNVLGLGSDVIATKDVAVRIEKL